MPMNKGRIAEDRFSLSKPNSEIKEIISEILKLCSDLFSGANSGCRNKKTVDKWEKPLERNDLFLALLFQFRR